MLEVDTARLVTHSHEPELRTGLQSGESLEYDLNEVPIIRVFAWRYIPPEMLQRRLEEDPDIDLDSFGFVQVPLLNKDSRIQGPSKGQTVVPGGKILVDEVGKGEHPILAAAREVYEEAGARPIHNYIRANEALRFGVSIVNDGFTYRITPHNGSRDYRPRRVFLGTEQITSNWQFQPKATQDQDKVESIEFYDVHDVIRQIRGEIDSELVGHLRIGQPSDITIDAENLELKDNLLEETCVRLEAYNLAIQNALLDTINQDRPKNQQFLSLTQARQSGDLPDGQFIRFYRNLVMNNRFASHRQEERRILGEGARSRSDTEVLKDNQGALLGKDVLEVFEEVVTSEHPFAVMNTELTEAGRAALSYFRRTLSRSLITALKDSFPREEVQGLVRLLSAATLTSFPDFAAHQEDFFDEMRERLHELYMTNSFTRVKAIRGIEFEYMFPFAELSRFEQKLSDEIVRRLARDFRLKPKRVMTILEEVRDDVLDGYFDRLHADDPDYEERAEAHRLTPDIKNGPLSRVFLYLFDVPPAKYRSALGAEHLRLDAAKTYALLLKNLANEPRYRLLGMANELIDGSILQAFPDSIRSRIPAHIDSSGIEYDPPRIFRWHRQRILTELLPLKTRESFTRKTYEEPNSGVHDVTRKNFVLLEDHQDALLRPGEDDHEQPLTAEYVASRINATEEFINWYLGEPASEDGPRVTLNSALQEFLGAEMRLHILEEKEQYEALRRFAGFGPGAVGKLAGKRAGSAGGRLVRKRVFIGIEIIGSPLLAEAELVFYPFYSLGKRTDGRLWGLLEKVNDDGYYLSRYSAPLSHSEHGHDLDRPKKVVYIGAKSAYNLVHPSTVTEAALEVDQRQVLKLKNR